MSEMAQIADQFERSMTGDAWHGPALLELLGQVDAAQALRRPLRQAHNVWEIVHHVTVWQNAAAGALKGKPMPNLAPAEDWPAAGTTESEWQEALSKLKRAGEELGAAIKRSSDARLGEQVPGREYAYYYLLHGIVQHTLYHAGQIALLKKAAATS